MMTVMMVGLIGGIIVFGTVLKTLYNLRRHKESVDISPESSVKPVPTAEGISTSTDGATTTLEESVLTEAALQIRHIGGSGGASQYQVLTASGKHLGHIVRTASLAVFVPSPDSNPGLRAHWLRPQNLGRRGQRRG